MFGLRRLQGNPPRSLWLQHIHRMCCLTRRAHIAQTRVIFLQNHTSFARGEVGTLIEKYRPLVMTLVHGRKKFTLARSLVLIVKFGAHRLAAVAARVPASKRQSSSISTLRMSVRYLSALQVRGRRFSSRLRISTFRL